MRKKRPSKEQRKKERIKVAKLKKKLQEAILYIYYDPKTGKYYYPKAATEEEQIVYRMLIVQRPDFDYDPTTDAYYSTAGEAYYIYNSPEEFKANRDLTLRNLSEEYAADMVPNTPIFYHPRTEKYYYPKLAAIEYTERPREIITETDLPLIFLSKMNLFADKITGEPYYELKSPIEFPKLRAKGLKMQDEIMVMDYAERTPIYNDTVSRVNSISPKGSIGSS